MLKEYIKDNNIKSGSVFVSKNGRPLDSSNIWSDIKKLCESAGVSKDKVFPHNLRHLFTRTYYSLQKDAVRLAELEYNNEKIYSDDDVLRHFAEDLCEKGEKQGLLAVGYSCYGGNSVFEYDWKRAEECMLKLIETAEYMPDRAFYANTLGYIYYYGRCNDDIPQYEEAYKIFKQGSLEVPCF